MSAPLWNHTLPSDRALHLNFSSSIFDLRFLSNPVGSKNSAVLFATTFGTFPREFSSHVAPAVNPVQKSSRRVGYLRATVKDSNFCKALLFQDFRIRVARESLRRAFGTGSLTFGSELSLPVGLQKTPSARGLGVFSYLRPRQDFRRFRLPTPDSLVRNRDTGSRVEMSHSGTVTVPNGPKLSDSLVNNPLQVNRTFRHGGPWTTAFELGQRGRASSLTSSRNSRAG